MLLSRRRLLLTRVLPLAAIGAGLLVLIPSDFRAAANTITQASQPAQTPAPVKVSMPAPKIISMPSLVANAAPSTPPVTVAPGASSSVEIQTAEATTTDTTAMPSVAPAVAPTNARVLHVGASGVNVRADAVKGADVLFTLSANAPVQAAETVNGWVHVYTDSGAGWVYASYLTDGSTPAPMRTQISASSGAAQSFVGHNVRLRADTMVYDQPDGQRLYVLDGGERIQIAEANGDWARIITDTDESGWIRVR